MHKLVLMLLMGAAVHDAHALFIDNDVLVMNADESFKSRSFINDSKQKNLYKIKMYQIDRPGKNEKKQVISNGEMMYSPLSAVVNADQMEYFKIFYSGPDDDMERYYRVIIQEIPARIGRQSNLKKQQSGLISSIALDTYVVVRPRQQNVAYQYNDQLGTFTNNGNAFIRVLLHRGCLAGNEPIVYDVLPGETLKHELLKGENRKYIANQYRYIRFGNQCASIV